MKNSSKILAAALFSAVAFTGSVQTATAQIVILHPEYEQYVQDQERCRQKHVDAVNACTANKSLTVEQYKKCRAEADAEKKKCDDFARYMYDLASRSRRRY